jgi:excinuclease ABC subunit A
VNDVIRVRGAREHNLKNVDLEIPRNRLVVITGVSGSGKSSLAFDTLFAEGQRRYVESLSAYARQFLEQMEKPDVDSIEGLSPAISIEQKTVSKNPRSTVGTVTEIHDYLRLLFASIGVPHCPSAARRSARRRCSRWSTGPRAARGDAPGPLRALRARQEGRVPEAARPDGAKEGFVRARIDGETVDLDGELPALDKQKKHSIDVVVDRLVVKPGIERRLADSLETALKVGGGSGDRAPRRAPRGDALAELRLRRLRHQPGRDHAAPLLVQQPLRRLPDLLGPRHPQPGRPEKVVISDPSARSRPAPSAPGQPGARSWRMRMLRTLAKAMGSRSPRRGRSCRSEVREVILTGRRPRARLRARGRSKLELQVEGQLRGRHPAPRAALQGDRLAAWCAARSRSTCRCTPAPPARAAGCKPEALAVKVAGQSIDEISRDDGGRPAATLRRPRGGALRARAPIADKILKEIADRLGFLDDVGVGYLTLDRRRRRSRAARASASASRPRSARS